MGNEPDATIMRAALGIVRIRLEQDQAPSQDPDYDLAVATTHNAQIAMLMLDRFGVAGIGTLLYSLSELAADHFRSKSDPLAALEAVEVGMMNCKIDDDSTSG